MSIDVNGAKHESDGKFGTKSGAAPEIGLGRQLPFHRDLGFPSNFTAPQRVVRLVYSPHAKTACFDDRYGTIPELETLDLSKADLIEIEMANGKCTKYLYRAPLPDLVRGQELDVCIALDPVSKLEWRVKTVWFNRRDDLHRTLDKSKYQTP